MGVLHLKSFTPPVTFTHFYAVLVLFVSSGRTWILLELQCALWPVHMINK